MCSAIHTNITLSHSLRIVQNILSSTSHSQLIPFLLRVHHPPSTVLASHRHTGHRCRARLRPRACGVQRGLPRRADGRRGLRRMRPRTLRHRGGRTRLSRRHRRAVLRPLRHQTVLVHLVGRLWRTRAEAGGVSVSGDGRTGNAVGKDCERKTLL